MKNGQLAKDFQIISITEPPEFISGSVQVVIPAETETTPETVKQIKEQVKRQNPDILGMVIFDSDNRLILPTGERLGGGKNDVG